jgi:hypothetical protein
VHVGEYRADRLKRVLVPRTSRPDDGLIDAERGQAIEVVDELP